MNRLIYNDRVYSSNFRNVDKYIMSNRQISIARSTPKGFKGSRLDELMPSWELINNYKSGALTEEEYEDTYYREVLNKLSAIEVYEKLKGKVICCYEDSGVFCHRHIVMNWLLANLDYTIIGGEL